MAYKDARVRRERDRERFHRRIAERLARGLCPRCGKTPPEPERKLCASCTGKRNRASRARDARLKAADKPRRDPVRARAYEKKRSRQAAAERRTRGLCPRCGKEPPAPDRSICPPCGEKRRADARARYAEARKAGKPYGGRDPKGRRRLAREKSRKRQKARHDAGQCTRCGARQPVEGGSVCQPCGEDRRVNERRAYRERRVNGLCTRCGVPTFNGISRCAVCAVRESGRQDRKNAAARRRYAERRARNRCTDCGESSQGACRCEDCAKRSYERSDHHRGMPLYPTTYTVIELATGIEHGPFDSEADVSMCLAFARLSRDRVEVLVDRPEIAIFAAWE